MSWLDDLTSAPAKALCTFAGGHEYRRHGDYLVCESCGHRVEVTKR